MPRGVLSVIRSILSPNRGALIQARGALLQARAAVDATNPLANIKTSLISWWDLDEASGTRNDAHSTNHLTDNNTVTQAAGVSAGTGNAAQFTAANSEYLSIADNAALSTGDIDFTFAGWVYMDSLADEDFWGKWSTANEGEYFMEYAHTGGAKFRFAVSSNGTAVTGSVLSTLPSPASTATWYFVVAWHDSVGNTINIQVNDGTAGSAAYSAGVRNSTSPFEVGRAVSTRYVNGRVDSLGFWKRTLTAAEKTALYNSGAGKRYSDLP